MNYTCPVCKQLYQQPVTLPCGHLVCQKCVKSLQKNSFFSCSVCKQEFKNFNINQLQIDHELDEICQRVKKYQIKQANTDIKTQQGISSDGLLTEHTTASLGDCILSAQSQLDKSMSTQGIKVAYKGDELPQAYEKLLNDLYIRLEGIQSKQQYINQEGQQLNENIQNVTQKVHLHFDQLVEMINLRRNDILNEIQQVYDNYRSDSISINNILNQSSQQLNDIKQNDLENNDYANKYEQLQQISINLDQITFLPLVQLDCIFQQSIQQEIKTHGKLIIQKDVKSKLRQQQCALDLPQNYIYYDLQHPRDLDNSQSANSFVQLCQCRITELQQHSPKQYEQAIDTFLQFLNTECRDKQPIENQQIAAYIVGYLGSLANIPQELFNFVQKQFNSIIHSYQHQLKKCNAQIAALRNYTIEDPKNHELICPTNHRIFTMPNYVIGLLSYLNKAYSNVQKMIQQQLQKAQEQLQHIQHKYQQMAQQYYQKKQSLLQLHSKLQKNHELHISEVEMLSNSPKAVIQNTQQDHIKDISNKVSEIERQGVLLKEQFNADAEKLLAYELGLRRECQNMIQSLLQLKRQQLSDNEAINNIVCHGVKSFTTEICKEINQINRNDYIQSQEQNIFSFELKILFNAFLEFLSSSSVAGIQQKNQITPIEISIETDSETDNQTTQTCSELKQNTLKSPNGAIGLCIAKQDYIKQEEDSEITLIKGQDYWVFKYEKGMKSVISSLKYPKICFEVPSDNIQLTKSFKQDFKVDNSTQQTSLIEFPRNITQNQSLTENYQLISNDTTLKNTDYTKQPANQNPVISIQELATVQNDFPKTMKAKFAFQANDENDLETEKGDKLIIYNILDGGEWYKAKNLRTNVIGLIPVSYIE